jgi:hypothetical protein
MTTGSEAEEVKDGLMALDIISSVVENQLP